MPLSKVTSCALAFGAISVFAVQAALSGGKTLMLTPADTLLDLGANFGPLTLLEHQYWRLLTFGWVHASVIHLALNCYALIEFGPMAESALGRRNFLFIYFVCGVIGGLTSILLNPIQTSVGASASICGILGAFIFVSWCKRVPPDAKRLSKPELALLLVFLSYSLILGMTSDTVDNGAHLGGFFSGVLAAAMLTVPHHSPAASFRIRLTSAVALLALCPVLAEIGSRRMDKNPIVDTYLLTTSGIKLIHEKKYLHGMDALNKALAIAPEDKTALLARGEGYMELDQFDPAKEDFDHVLKLDPKNKGALARRSQVYHELDMPQMAVKDMDSAIELDPNQSVLYNNRAWSRLALWRDAGEIDKCIADCDHAIKLDKSLATTYDTRGTAYLFKGDYKAARADFAKSRKLARGESKSSSLGAAALHDAILDHIAGDEQKAQSGFAAYKDSDYEADDFEREFYKEKYGLDILDKTAPSEKKED